MTVFPEVILQQVIAQSIVDAKSRPDMVRHLMREFHEEAQADATSYLLKESFRVVTKYPRTDPSFPMIWIGLKGEAEVNQVLGDLIDISAPYGETYDMETLGSSVPGVATTGPLQGHGDNVAQGYVSQATPRKNHIVVDAAYDPSLVGCRIAITGGKGLGQSGEIIDVFGDDITTDTFFEPSPDSTSTYQVTSPSLMTGHIGTPPKNYQQGSYVLTKGAGFRHQFMIQCLTTGSPHTSLFIYALLKATIYMRKAYLDNAGIKDISLSGTDLSIHPELFPSEVFSRSLMVDCVSYFTIPEVISTPSEFEFNVELTKADHNVRLV